MQWLVFSDEGTTSAALYAQRAAAATVRGAMVGDGTVWDALSFAGQRPLELRARLIVSIIQQVRMCCCLCVKPLPQHVISQAP